MPAKPNKPRTAASILHEWAQTQPQWVQALVSEAIAQRCPLGSAEVHAAYLALLGEEALTRDGSAGGDVGATPAAVAVAGADQEEVLALRAISEVENVNALVTGQRIEFNEHLTLLFGENGSGKSGPSRVIARAAGARSTEKILGNVHEDPVTSSPRATIEVRVGEAEETLAWNNETGLKPLDRISLFDARYSHLHVDGALEYVYTPRELATFTYVRDAISGVKERLSNEAGARQARCDLVKLLETGAFGEETVVAVHLRSLSHETNPKDLNELAVLSPEESAALAELPETVERLDPRTAEQKLEIARRDEKFYKELCEIARTAVGLEWEQLQAALDERTRTKALYVEQSSKEIRADDMFGGASEEWKAFVHAGEQLLEKLGRGDYPGSDDECAYCGQHLSDQARARLRRFRRYVDNPAARAFAAAKERYQELLSPLARHDVPRISAGVRERLKAVSETPARDLLRESLRLLDEFEAARTAAAAGERARGADVRAVASTLLSNLEIAATRVERDIRMLDKEAERLKADHERALKRLESLRARLALSRRIGEVTDMIADLRWVHRATVALGRFSGIIRSLSRATTAASTELINTRFSQVFEEERELLRAPTIAVQYPGVGGKASRKKHVGKRKPSEVLSEGEQKVVALADFLAEVRIREPKGPVIFDDPVTSLDYRRLGEVADRIVSLAKTHQVIVFTHDIMLVAELMDRFTSSERSMCSLYSVTHEGAPGRITLGRHPKWDSPGNLAVKINEEIAQANRTSGETRESHIREAYSLLRAWLEVVAERDLFKKVTERYRPHIALGNLAEINIGELERAREVFLRVFATCCRLTPAHSQAGRHAFMVPRLEELEEDWDEVSSIRNAHKKRR